MGTTAISSLLGPRFEMVSGDVAKALEQMNLPANAVILDVGTGSGNCAISLASHGYRVVTGEPATDRSHYSGRDWAAAAAELGVRDSIEFKAFDASKLPFASGAFAAIFFFGVLHHIGEVDRPEVLREALRVAEPGGAVVFFEPRQEMLEKILVDDPAHPPAANPSDYLPMKEVSEKRIAGSWMDIFIYQQGESIM